MTARPDIRPAMLSDVTAMHRIRLAVRENVLSDPSRIRSSHYVEMLTRYGRGWVAELDAEVVGFVIADGVRHRLWALFVAPPFESRGIGRTLLGTAVGWLVAAGAVPVTLTTEPGTRAARFYEAGGWRPVGREPNGETRYELDAVRARDIATRAGRGAPADMESS